MSGATGCNSVARPRRNRVTPFGNIEATAAKGNLMGNRGDLHSKAGALATNWKLVRWITCCLHSTSDRPVTFDTPGHYYPLFFLDEAVALAAGHRPCASCRRSDYERFRLFWRKAYNLERLPSAVEIDNSLHAGRLTSEGTKATWLSRLTDLPSGTFVTVGGSRSKACLYTDGYICEWHHEGYGPLTRAKTNSVVQVLTPSPIVDCIRAGYVPKIAFAQTSKQSDGYTF